MKANAILTALNTNLRTVAVQFKDMNGEAFGKAYTYKTDLQLEAGDDVVVDAPSTGMTVVVVKEVHELPQLDGGYNYKWVVCKVDASGHEERLAREAELEKEFAVLKRKADKVRMIAQLKADLGFGADEECEELNALIAKVTAQ